MNIAHQPGSEPLTIPEQIPNPAVRPVAPPSREPRPDRKEPAKGPEKVPANRVPAFVGVSAGGQVRLEVRGYELSCGAFGVDVSV